MSGGPLILHIVGARPNFMKVAPVLAALRAHPVRQRLVHTGQHYDAEMSEVFLDELGMPEPDDRLEVGSGSHSAQVGKILLALGELFDRERPDLVVVAGDVNSTLAGALAAVQHGTSVAHLEAGLRSFDRTMPEEVNRRLTDHASALLLTHCEDANANLRAEGIDSDRIELVGNTMIDSLRRLLPSALELAPERTHGVEPGRYVLVTLHRPATVDDPEMLRRVLDSLELLARELPVVFPLHPRTRARIDAIGWAPERVKLVGPSTYLEFIALESSARAVLTDSGGVQEETTALGVPCFTFRAVTERPVTCTAGTNQVVGTDPDVIPGLLDLPPALGGLPPFWDGAAGVRAASRIASFVGAGGVQAEASPKSVRYTST